MKNYVPERFLWTLIFLTLLFPAGIFSQTRDTAASNIEESTPHVTDLHAESRNNLVRLTWKDSPLAQGPVYIYRSYSPFNPANPLAGQPRPVEIPYGVESYIDETESSGVVHYFVAASNMEGQVGGSSISVTGVFNTVLPFKNTVSVIAQFEAPVISAPAERSSTRDEPGITRLEAVINGEGVTVSYQVSDHSRDTVLYRSVQPIQKPEDLLRAVIVQSGLTSPFVDFPVPGIPCYYAVIFEDELPRGSVTIIPGTNATTKAVELSTHSGRVGLPGANVELRSIPLPLMALNYAVPGIDSFPEVSAPIPLSSRAASAILDFRVKEPESAAPKNPRAFHQDLQEDDNSLWEEYSLKTIVEGPFLARNWPAVITELNRFLSLPRSDLTTARARFYLGQGFYFSAQYQEALFEFLIVKTKFPKEANEWIEATLAALTSAK
ncbi:hypothetical protein FACS1894140_1590 [Spirochaetia bacterium]|nr:hypothetical protein FACS1894140_1590 [Spirochaetia bacterium]